MAGSRCYLTLRRLGTAVHPVHISAEQLSAGILQLHRGQVAASGGDYRFYESGVKSHWM